MIKLELSEQVIAQIMEALAAQPLGKSFDAFVTIRSQIAQQRVPVSPPTPPPSLPDQPKPPVPNGSDI